MCAVDSNTRAGAAMSFLHLLKLEKRGLVYTHQDPMWADITITLRDGGDDEVRV